MDNQIRRPRKWEEAINNMSYEELVKTATLLVGVTAIIGIREGQRTRQAHGDVVAAKLLEDTKL